MLRIELKIDAHSFEFGHDVDDDGDTVISIHDAEGSYVVAINFDLSQLLAFKRQLESELEAQSGQ